MDPAQVPLQDAFHAVHQQACATGRYAIMLMYRVWSALLFLSTGRDGLASKGYGANPALPSVSPKHEQLQDLVTWDEHSIFVRGERIMLYSGEFHPFRLPVPDLWLDIFHKLRSAGFSAVSFYTYWALHETKAGNFSAEGIFALEPFFAAAQEAGIYLIARPGPYINAEVSGGGFPGWLQRTPEFARTPEFLAYTENYVKQITPIIAKAQITNGGPVILFQPENEYTLITANVSEKPDAAYFAETSKMFRDAGITVPFISNDQTNKGYFAPGTGKGAVDIYGYDAYPLGFDCSNPRNWPDGALPTDYQAAHAAQSPSTPHSILEFQAGAFDYWGGPGSEQCAVLVNPDFQRVFYKNLYAAHLTILNLYMAYGGTNWGNLGHPVGYTSYDYGAIIKEDRTVTRAKYSELKLQTNFLKVSPEYLVATPEPSANGSYADSPDLATTKLSSGKTSFYVVRHAKFNSNATTAYRLNVPSSAGTLSLPKNGKLTLNARDSKTHVVDYEFGGNKLLYSTAEVFTWQKYEDKTVLILYGAPGESHEACLLTHDDGVVVEGTGLTIERGTLQWSITKGRGVVRFSDLYVYLINREDAFDYWVLDLPEPAPFGRYTTAHPTSVIVRGGYLLRTAALVDGVLSLVGDVNATTSLEIINGGPCRPTLLFNGDAVPSKCDSDGVLHAVVNMTLPDLKLPHLQDLHWTYIDSLPEVQPSYDDAAWVRADRPTSNNIKRPLTTPTSLYGSDYGFHTGTLLTRGRFTATGAETFFFAETWGGYGFATAIFLDGTQLAAFAGSGADQAKLQNVTLPALTPGRPYVLTVLTDNMGLEEDFVVGSEHWREPRGLVDYALGGRRQADVAWAITGNLGGEDYRDRARGPLNEGGLWAERQGFHLPGAPAAAWAARSPFEGIPGPGVGFFAAHFRLDMPAGYDIPLAFEFANTTGTHYRCQLFVNGYQFGKYVNNVGPQTRFPVPEGILNHHGNNYVALSLWGFDEGGNSLSGLELVSTAVVKTGYKPVKNAPLTGWKKRYGAY